VVSETQNVPFINNSGANTDSLLIAIPTAEDFRITDFGNEVRCSSLVLGSESVCLSENVSVPPSF